MIFFFSNEKVLNLTSKSKIRLNLLYLPVYKSNLQARLGLTGPNRFTEDRDLDGPIIMINKIYWHTLQIKLVGDR